MTSVSYSVKVRLLLSVCHWKMYKHVILGEVTLVCGVTTAVMTSFSFQCLYSHCDVDVNL